MADASILAALTGLIARSRPGPALLSQILEQTVLAVGGSHAVLLQADRGRGPYLPLAGWPAPPPAEAWFSGHDALDPCDNLLAGTLTPVRGALPPYFATTGCRHVWLSPVAGEDGPTALLVIGTTGVLAPGARALLTAAADALAVAIRLQRLARDAALPDDILAAVREMGDTPAGLVPAAPALDAFCRRAAPLLGATGAAVWQYDRETRELVLAGHSGERLQTPATRIMCNDATHPAACGFRRDTACVLEDTGSADRPTVTVGLAGRRRALGTLVFERASLSDFERPALEHRAALLARHLSAALENGQLLDQVVASHRQLAQSEKLAALGQFVAGAAHELNNPLQGVIGHLDLLRMQLPARLRADARRIHREADRAAKIVRQLLTFAGPRPLDRRRVTLSRLISRVLALRSRPMRAAGIRVVREDDGSSVVLHADPVLLQQALLNVLVNAEQALAGRPDPCITLSSTTQRDRRRVLIRIVDNGPGIPEAVLPHLFEPFFTTREVGQGTGLGLAVTHGIVREHDGSIRAASHDTPGMSGAVFTIELPISALK